MEPLYIIIPAYNEQENITNIMTEWYSIIETHAQEQTSRLVVIDDGSNDATFEMMQEFAKTHPLFVPITQENAGHGAAIYRGYQYALEAGAAYIFQTDSDGQTLASEFEDFWKEREETDALIGSREHRKDGIGRVFVAKVLRLVLWICFSVRVKDANTPYRLMRAEVLRDEISYVPKDFFLTNVLLSVLFIKHNRTVKFLPITFLNRQGGKNSVNFRKIIAIGRKAFVEFYRMSREKVR